jgi:glycine oxidase
VSTYDVAIIGSGIIGGSIAFELARHKLRVIVLDSKEPGREASWAAAGMLSPAPDSPDSILLVPLARASLELYPAFVGAVEEASGLKAGFRHNGALELLFAGDAERELSTLIALHHGLGLAAEPLRADDALELEPHVGRDVRAAALLPDEACVDNRALTAAVLAAATASGVTIRDNTAVTALVRESGRCAGVVAAGQRITAGCVVLAGGCYSASIDGLAIYAPTHPVRGQMVALLSPTARLRRVVRSERGYIVPRDDAHPQKLVAGSTLENVGFEKKTTAAGIEQILSAALELVPGLKDAEIAETWCGLRPDTPDHLPVLGPTDVEGLLIATGHYRNGILLAPVTAKLMREWIVEKRVSLDVEPFSPLRFLEARSAGPRTG